MTQQIAVFGVVAGYLIAGGRFAVQARQRVTQLTAMSCAGGRRLDVHEVSAGGLPSASNRLWRMKLEGKPS
jgi:hypothetical protein